MGGNRFYIVDTFKYAQEKLFLAGKGNPVYRNRLTLATNDVRSEYTDVYDMAHHAIVLCCSNMSNRERKDYIDKIRDNPHLHYIVHAQIAEESEPSTQAGEALASQATESSAASASMETNWKWVGLIAIAWYWYAAWPNRHKECQCDSTQSFSAKIQKNIKGLAASKHSHNFHIFRSMRLARIEHITEYSCEIQYNAL